MPDTNTTSNSSIPKPNHSSQRKIKESLLPLPPEIFNHIVSFFGHTRPIASLKEAARSELIPETPFCKIMDMVDKHFPHNYEWMFKVLRAHEQKGNRFMTWDDNYQVLKTLYKTSFAATIENEFSNSSKERLQNFQNQALIAMLESLADFENIQLETLLQEAIARTFEEHFPATYQNQLKTFRGKCTSLLLWDDNYHWLKELFHDDYPLEYQSLTEEFQQYEQLTQLLQYYANVLKQFKLQELMKNVMDPCQFYYDILIAYDCQSFIFTRTKLKRQGPQTMREQRYLYELETRGFHGFKELFKYVKFNDLQAFNAIKPTEDMLYLLYYVNDKNDWSVFDWAKKLDKQKMLDRFWIALKGKSLGDQMTNIWNFADHIEVICNYTLLHWGIACQQPVKNFSSLHISAEAILKTNLEGQNSFHFAARNKKLDWLEYLLNCLKKNKQALHTSDRSGNTPLLTAAIAGNLKAVNLLLTSGASIDATNQKGQTLVSLLASQLNMHHNEVRHITALHIATLHLPVNNLSTLLATRGNEINVQGVTGNTPLHLAASKGDIEKVKLLLNHGANPHLKNNKGQTALHFAAQSSLEVVKVLRDVGAMVDLQDLSEQSLYLSAARGGNIECMKFFEPDNATKETNNNGENALHLAVKSGNPKAVEYLIERQFDVGIKNKEGHTPLNLAFLYKHRQTVLVLLKTHPDWHCSDKKESNLLKKHLTKNSFLWAVLELREYIVKLTKEVGSVKSNKFVLFNKEKNAAVLTAKLAAAKALERVILHGEDRAILNEHEAIFDKKDSTLSKLKAHLLTTETQAKVIASRQ